MYALFFFSTLFINFVASESPWTLCDERGSDGSINSVKIDDCDDVKKCLIKRGENATITVKFSVSEKIKNPERVVYAVLDDNGDGKPLEIPHGRPTNVCPNLLGDEQCVNNNLVPEKTYKHVSVFQVPGIVPKIELNVRLLVRERHNKVKKKKSWLLHSGKIAYCIKVPISVVD